MTEGSHCDVCKAVLTAPESVPALGHTVVVDPAVSPTKKEPGLTEGSHCSACKTVLTPQEVIAPTGCSATIVGGMGIMFLGILGAAIVIRKKED